MKENDMVILIEGGIRVGATKEEAEALQDEIMASEGKRKFFEFKGRLLNVNFIEAIVFAERLKTPHGILTPERP